MDHIDLKILELLKKNSRIKFSEIKDVIHLSLPAISERIKKLEENGIIDQYTVKINRKKMGYHMLSFILVNIQEKEAIDEFKALVSQKDNILECYHLAGEYDYLIKIATKDNEELAEFITHTIKSLPGHIKTNSVIVLSTVKEKVNA